MWSVALCVDILCLFCKESKAVTSVGRDAMTILKVLHSEVTSTSGGHQRKGCLLTKTHLLPAHCTHKHGYIFYIEMFYLNSTLNFGIPPVLVFQLEVYYKVDRLLTGLTAQQKGTTARWYSNKTSLHVFISRIRVKDFEFSFVSTKRRWK